MKLQNSLYIDKLKEDFKDQITIGKDCYIDPSVRIEISTQGQLIIENGTKIMRGTSIEVLRGGKVVICPNVNIGENCFIAAMSIIILGEGAALSNMVDIHDHNHKDRADLNMVLNTSRGNDVNTSGFEVAPIIIEPFATISNKVSVTAGVRVGQNVKVGANAVVSRSLPPNCVAVGVPARAARFFPAKIKPIDYNAKTRVAFFGTSIMQHLEAYVPDIYDQMNLPEIGSSVTVQDWVCRGYVHRIQLMLESLWPHIEFDFKNYGCGGANIRKLFQVVEKKTSTDLWYDLVIFGGGINDIWRRFQGRSEDAVDIQEYEKNYKRIVEKLASISRKVICVPETPVNNEYASEINEELVKYNRVAFQIAKQFNTGFVDFWKPFINSACFRTTKDGDSLWSDGVHLSEKGDSLLAVVLDNYLRKEKIIENLLTFKVCDRSQLKSSFRHVFDGLYEPFIAKCFTD